MLERAFPYYVVQEGALARFEARPLTLSKTSKSTMRVAPTHADTL
jgi:hypothetical protein